MVSQRYLQRHKQRQSAAGILRYKIYYQKNRSRILAYQKKWRASLVEYSAVSHSRSEADYRRANTYGITPALYIKLLGNQLELCAICALKKPLEVDHDHKTGEIRGLVCRKCNHAIGMYETGYCKQERDYQQIQLYLEG